MSWNSESELTASEILEQHSENKFASEYDTRYHSPPIYQAHSRDYADYLLKYIKSGDRVLDLGCASASLWPFLIPFLPDNVQLVGMDLSPEMIAIASKKYPDHVFKVGTFRSLPFQDISFDTVIVSSAFHHIHDQNLSLCLDEVFRVLEEHGQLIGREPLSSNRFVDRGGYMSGVLMHLRHLMYFATNTKEYPEPDPGPDHHAYVANKFIDIINTKFTVSSLSFRNPVSPIFGRIENKTISNFALFLDKVLSHREGNEIWYIALKNHSEISQLHSCIDSVFSENHISQSELLFFNALVKQIIPDILAEIKEEVND